MRRRAIRPFGASMPPTRWLSALLMLGIVWMIYDRSRDPRLWQWIEESKSSDVTTSIPAAPVAATPEQETLVEGPDDRDEDSVKELNDRLYFVTDRAQLRKREMLAYWQLMAWSRAQPLKEFEKRANPEPAFTQLWEEPAKFRGKPIRLRLHLKRVLKYDAPENPLGLTTVYEAWGWTDESKSFPYVLVLPELPPGIPLGNDIQGEVVFTGYFLKIMSYTAYDAKRGAPLLIGRMRTAGPTVIVQPVSESFGWLAWTVIPGVVLIALTVVMIKRFFPARPPYQPSSLPDDFSLAPPVNPSGTLDDTLDSPFANIGVASRPPAPIVVHDEPEVVPADHEPQP